MVSGACDQRVRHNGRHGCTTDTSMKIKIRPIGLIKRFAQESEIETEAGLTPRKLISDLGIPAELKMVSFVNGTRTDLDHELHDGDEVKLVTLVTGG